MSIATAFENLWEAFPKIKEAIYSAEKPEATTRVWFEVVSDCDPDDVHRVVGMMVSGDLPLPPAYERDQIPQIIRREANKMRADRSDHLESERRQDIGRKRQTSDAQEFGRILQLARTYKPEELPKLIALSRQLEIEEPRFFCVDCRDTGFVPVWSNETIDDVLRCAAEPKRKIVNAACNCVRGAGARSGSGRWRPLVCYDDQRFCHALDGELDTLRAWLNKG